DRTDYYVPLPALLRRVAGAHRRRRRHPAAAARAGPADGLSVPTRRPAWGAGVGGPPARASPGRLWGGADAPPDRPAADPRPRPVPRPPAHRLPEHLLRLPL